MVYVALLRGINVGGHAVSMQRLRALFAGLGLARVRSYIQSGNVFFETDATDRAARSSMIERRLGDALGYAVPVFLRTLPELERIVASEAFAGLAVTPEMRLCVAFMAGRIAGDLALPLYTPRRDMAILHTTEQEAFVVWYLINGRPPTSQGVVDGILGGVTTTRFFHTTAKILAAARRGAD